MRVTSKDGFVFRFDNSYEKSAEPFDFVKVWQISEYTLDPNREILEHVQFCHEITYVISGKATFLSGDAQDELQQGDLHRHGADNTKFHSFLLTPGRPAGLR